MLIQDMCQRRQMVVKALQTRNKAFGVSRTFFQGSSLHPLTVG